MTVFQNLAQSFIQPEVKSALPEGPSLTELLMATSKAVDLLEGRTLRHGIRVTLIAGTIGTMLQLPRRDLVGLLYASLIHDVGLAYVMGDIAPRLAGGGVCEKAVFGHHPLTSARVYGNPFEAMHLPDGCELLLKGHPQAASRFLEQVFLGDDIKSIVEASHEYLDGTGYPFGLSGEAIPLPARILSFADTVETLMDQVTGLNERKKVLEGFLDLKAPSKFDSQVIACFLALINDPQDHFLRLVYGNQTEELVLKLFGDHRHPLPGNQLLKVVKAMAQLPDLMMPLYTKSHALKVASIAQALARHLGIHPAQLGELITAALLMNIGMVALPYSHLIKSDTLSKEAMARVQDHVHYTHEILKGITGFEHIIQWGCEHHERMNGSGYPGQKKGFELSTAGRILAIADVYTALTSPRPYRIRAYEPMEAIPVMGQGRYRLYDNQLISALRTIVVQSDLALAHL